MSKITTVKKFLHQSKSLHDMWDNTRGKGEWDEEAIANSHIEFAKLHVEAALEEAAIKAKILEKSNWGKWEDSENEKGNLEEKVSVKINHYGHGDCSYQILTVSHESILKAYPLTNIK